MNARSWKCRAMVVAVAGATAITGAFSASAAPVLTSTAAVKQALPNDVQDVRWGWGGGAFFGGLIAGGLIGAAIAQPYYYGGYYPAYGYGYSPSAYGYAYPAYSYGYGYGSPYGYSYPYYSGSYYGGGYYGGWRGVGWRGYAGRGAYVGHYARAYRR